MVPALLALALTSGEAAPVTIASPNGRLTVAAVWEGFDGPAHWSLRRGGRDLLDDCRLGLTVLGAGDLMEGALVTKVERSSHRETIRVLFGKSESASNDYEEMRVTVQNWSGAVATVVFRCFDDAVAFRYEAPAVGARTVVTEEQSSFKLVGNPKAHVQYLEHFQTSHEHLVSSDPYGEVSQNQLVDTPATFEYDDGTAVAITEAALRMYAGMSLVKKGDHLVSALAPRPDGTKVVREGPVVTPWRVVLIGRSLGSLLESNTVYCLNEPSAIKDTSWIKPGKMTWPWWNGNLYGPVRTDPVLSFTTVKKYIDFCAENGIAYNSVVADETDTPWYTQPNRGLFPGPGTDVTKPRADLDLQRIVSYSKVKGVRTWTWAHQAALRGRVEEAFAAFERLGWDGMMVDFFDHDDQDSVEHAEAILQAAARHHIAVHFHGIWKPTGLNRTYPNLMNHEGALNLEYLKWRDWCSPEHDLNIAFTRLVAGPMDYHLGGFRAATKAQFKPQNEAPHVLGTRCHMLAMYVCYDNPQPMVADYPEAYSGQAGFDFVQEVPTWWDETRVLMAEYGRLLVTARRKGRVWYLGALASGPLQHKVLKLDFLGLGGYDVQSWSDVLAEGADPNAVQSNRFVTTREKPLHFRTGPDGGYVARLSPVDK